MLVAVGDNAFVHICLVVAVDLRGVVHVVDEQSPGLSHSVYRGITEPVDPLQASAIAKMKAGDGVGRLLTPLDVDQIVGARAQEHGFQSLGPSADAHTRRDPRAPGERSGRRPRKYAGAPGLDRASRQTPGLATEWRTATTRASSAANS